VTVLVGIVDGVAVITDDGVGVGVWEGIDVGGGNTAVSVISIETSNEDAFSKEVGILLWQAAMKKQTEKTSHKKRIVIFPKKFLIYTLISGKSPNFMKYTEQIIN